MTEKLKVSIQLKLAIPVEYNESGHRKSPTELIAPYIDRLYNDMRVQNLPYGDYEIEDIEDQEEYENLAAIHFGKDPERLAQIKKDLNEQTRSEVDQILHEMWKEGQNLVTQENYGMSWDEYAGLSDEKKAELHQSKDLSTETIQRLSERVPPHESVRKGSE